MKFWFSTKEELERKKMIKERVTRKSKSENICYSVAIHQRTSSYSYLMIVRITVNPTRYPTKAPCIDNPYEGSVVFVTKVAREGDFGKLVTIDDLPTSSMGKPIDHVHEIFA